MICTAISNPNFQEACNQAKTFEMAEVRIDLCKLNDAQVYDIFKLNTNLVATCRPEHVGSERRMELLKTSIKSGARYVDIEIESPRLFIDEMVVFAKEHHCDVIISYHNYDHTPEVQKLNEILDQCFHLGADVAKIAAQANSKQDAARLLSLYDSQRRLVILGMGDAGKITRVVAPIFGGEFTFAAPNNDKGTAPGQISLNKMKEALSVLQELGIEINNTNE